MQVAGFVVGSATNLFALLLFAIVIQEFDVVKCDRHRI
jgi:hypothetical protein